MNRTTRVAEAPLHYEKSTTANDLPPGYKRTEVGVIPEDWISTTFGKVLDGFFSGMTPYRGNPEFYRGNIKWVTSGELNYNVIKDTKEKITEEAVKKTNLKILPPGTFLMAITGLEAEGTRGSCAILGTYATTNQSCLALFETDKIITKYLFYYYEYYGDYLAFHYCQGTKQQSYTAQIVKKLPINLPPSLDEQRAIATALSDVDALITALEKLIAKKRAIKISAMQQLLTGKTRLPGFSGEWEMKRLGEITENLDNLRIPLNDRQRIQMPGRYPYCGANGILDYISDYIIDDDIILIAEDGGYFDEYANRPIAYRMKGKVWVNNHAHILKAKKGFSQDYIFYSIVHKNILLYLSGGTRAKLNKSQLEKIEIYIPQQFQEQTAIAKTLSDMDAEIDALEKRLEKTRAIKEGMMQELLTGRVRLVKGDRA